jgi:hypothetical protein
MHAAPDDRRRQDLEYDVQEAWESTRYWEDRHARLSPARRRARREAAIHAAAWKVRLKDAERAAYGPPLWEPVAVALRLHRLPERVDRFRRRARRAAITAVATLAVVAAATMATAAVLIEKALG